MLRQITVMWALCLISGCATFPDALQVSDESQLVTYQQVSAQPQASKGKLARWGGEIASIKNKPEMTVLEVVHYPLKSYGRPIDQDESIGRFRVNVDGFLDPMVYEKGRLVTFTGTVLGVEKGLVGEHEYVFPSLSSSAYHLWKKVTEQRTSLHIWPYGYYSGFGWSHRPYRGIFVVPRKSSISSNSTAGPRKVGRPSSEGASRE